MDVLALLIGAMGSGKSSEAVENHICPALKAGQHVATNIIGLNPDKLSAYLKIPVEQINELLVILPEDCDELRQEKYWIRGEKQIIPDGALVVIDEAWKLLDTQPPKYLLEYIRMQRHYVNEKTNFGGRMILAFQSFDDIHRSVRKVATVIYEMSEFRALGPLMNLASKLKLTKSKGDYYRVSVFTNPNRAPDRQKPVSILVRRRKPAIFELYKSTSAADGVQANRGKQDLRATIIGSKYVTLFIPLMLVLGYYAYGSLTEKFGAAFDDAQSTQAAESQSTSNTSTQVKAAPASQVQATVQLTPNSHPTFRLVGITEINGVAIVHVHDGKNVRTVYPGAIKSIVRYAGNVSVLLADNTIIDYYSGSNNAQTQTQQQNSSPGSAMHVPL